jgi:predicted nucleic-acid-binding protein
VLRFLLKDDPAQLAQARTLFRGLTMEQPGWIGTVTILEIVWVLSNSRTMNRESVALSVFSLLLLDTIVVENKDAVAWALQKFRYGKADFADCLIAASARAAGCGKTLTFDRIAARDAGMELIS